MRSSDPIQTSRNRDAPTHPAPYNHDAKYAPQRTVIIHYHLFKNAGTSVDEMLRQNFGSAWAEHEFPGSGGRRSNVEIVAQFLRDRSELSALSSHTAALPPPSLDGVTVLPVLFVRHPIDRLYSAYLFERKQVAETAGAKLAKERDFAGYLRELLKSPHRRQARNFQTYRLSMNEPASAGTDIERATRALDRLFFVGLVEAYEQSVMRLETLLRPSFPQFQAVSVRKNVTRPVGTPLKARLLEIKELLGDDDYAQIRAANRDDLKIFRKVKRWFELPGGRE